MMDFSNREIAGYIWLALFFGAAAFNGGVRQSFVGVLRAFCHPLIITPLSLAAMYIAACVIVFERIGIWTSANLKTTVLWALSFALATMFDINRVSEDRTFFKKAVREAFAIASVLTFMIEFYSFSLPVELVAVPLLTLLALLHIASDKPEHAQAQRLAGKLSAIVGIGYLTYSLYRTILDLKGFATLDTAREFGLPILLTLCFLPYLYALVIYVVYERSFIGLAYAIPDARLRRSAKWRAIFTFGPKLELLQRWVRSVQRFHPADRDALRHSFKEIKVLAQREAAPPPVASEIGWSPYLANDFLKEQGLPTRPYHRSYEDEWFAASDYLEIGNGFGLKNNLAYYLNGSEHAVSELKLKLHINEPDKPDEAEHRFRELGLILLSQALSQQPDSKILDQLRTGNFEQQIGGDLHPESWTVLSWKIPVMIGGSGYGVCDEEIEVQRGADRLRAQAGGGRHVSWRGMPQGRNQRGHVL